MSSHFPIAVLPGIKLGGNAEGGRIRFWTESLALVSTLDARVLCGEAFSDVMDRFVGSFRDEFGSRVEPSLIVCRHDGRASAGQRDAVRAFRNMIGMSTILLARARRIGLRSSPSGALWAESFEPYPWMVKTDGESLVALTPAMAGFATTEDFAGCSMPAVDQVVLTEADIDEPIFEALSRAWQAHFVEGQRCTESRALFRSIAAAQEALRLPGGPDATAETFGRLSIAWTSAFETLIWPVRRRRDVGWKDVIAVIDGIGWTSTRLKATCRSWTEEAGKQCGVSHPAWIYRGLNKLRNDYAHGNEIDGVPHADNGVIVRIAAVLFRCVLAQRLGVWRGKHVGSAGGAVELVDIERFVQAHLEQGKITRVGLEFERALLWYRGRSVLTRRRAASAPA
jgi:hypothetical protein